MPLSYLITLFIAMPVIELAVLFKIHNVIGLAPTMILVICTGVAGASLVKRQGATLLQRIQSEMAQGRLPAPELIDGLMVFAAGIMLLTPGVITDALGFTFLVPAARTLIRAKLKNFLQEKIQNGSMQVHYKNPYQE